MKPTKKKQAKLTERDAQDIAKWMSEIYRSPCEARCKWGEWVVVMKMRMEEEGVSYEEIARHLVYDSINDEDAVNKVATALQEAHDAGLEEGARVSEGLVAINIPYTEWVKRHDDSCRLVAKAIRSLKSKGGK